MKENAGRGREDSVPCQPEEEKPRDGCEQEEVVVLGERMHLCI